MEYDKFDLSRLYAAASPRPEASRQKAKERGESRAWRSMSQDIALAIHFHLGASGTSASRFAELLGEGPEYVAEALSGSHDFSLSEIARIEQALGASLVKTLYTYEAENR